MRSFGPPPSADEIEAIARRSARRAAARRSRDSLGDIVLLVEEFADDATLDGARHRRSV